MLRKAKRSAKKNIKKVRSDVEAMFGRSTQHSAGGTGKNKYRGQRKREILIASSFDPRRHFVAFRYPMNVGEAGGGQDLAERSSGCGTIRPRLYQQGDAHMEGTSLSPILLSKKICR